MRPVSLTVLKGGINRLRVKGGARADMLYDLQNAYVTQNGSITPREGTIRAETLDATTVGLCAVDGVFNVFSNSDVTVPSGYQCNVLLDPNDQTQMPKIIWFAKPFMGFLFVTCEFTNGDIFDYWLQTQGAWTANTVYMNGNIVTPTVPNGLGYLAVRDLPANALWEPQVAIALHQVIEPTEYTGYVYEATAVEGTSPQTSATEPVWPVVSGGTVQEYGNINASVSTATTTSSSGQTILSTAITDRYGDSSTVANSGSTQSGAGITLPSSAAQTVTTWAAGTLYAPGAVVQPSTSQGAYIYAIPNGDFANGDDGNWVGTGSSVTPDIEYLTSDQYQGAYCLAVRARNAHSQATMYDYGVCTPGQSVTVNAYLNPYPPSIGAASGTMFLTLNWYDSSNTLLSTTQSVYYTGAGYRPATVTGNAPSGAVKVKAAIDYGNTAGSAGSGLVGLISWTLEEPATVTNFLYEAVQSAAGVSAGVEPTWPTTAGNTVTDGGVTWEAIGTSIITWTAIPIMESGATQPTWPTVVGQTVADGTMSWQLVTRQITDKNDPNSIPTTIGASHVFKGGVDIVDYSAAVNPTDWTSANNAGYLPSGLNNYGDNPVAALGLYRSNLMVFNAGGYQMWQIDPDPANMALLDAQPIGCIYQRSLQAVANDLLLLTEVGVRNIGTVGATANMQIGDSGQPVDPLIKAQLQAATYTPISLYYPGRGQYWLMFGPQAFVLTQNGANQKSWSRYIFPDAITDWTLSEGILYLRSAGNLVWQFDENTLVDDYGGANVAFQGVMQWPYLDLQSLGFNKMVEGLDIVGDGQVTIQFGVNESDKTTFNDNPGFSTSLNVTPPYTIAVADTVPGTPIPFPMNVPNLSVILTFAGNQAWDWYASNLYLMDQSGGGVTGP